MKWHSIVQKIRTLGTNHELLLVNWEVTCFYAQNVVARKTKHFLTVRIPSNTVGIRFLKVKYKQNFYNTNKSLWYFEMF